MENNKIKRKVIAPNFGKHPKLALKLLEDEKKARGVAVFCGGYNNIVDFSKPKIEMDF